MGGQNSKSNVSTTSIDAMATAATSSGRMSTLTQLRGVVNDVNIFSEEEECIQFLNSIKNKKAFVITSGSLGQQCVPKIDRLSQLDVIYIFCGNKSRHDQ